MPYGINSHMPATLILHRKFVHAGGIVEMVLWRLPRPAEGKPHGLKYRLYFGRAGACLVRYDNERGKGDHRHYGTQEEPYRFVDVDRLLADFMADVRRLT